MVYLWRYDITVDKEKKREGERYRATVNKKRYNFVS